MEIINEETPISIESRKRRLEIEQKEKDFQRENIYTCCSGSKTDKRVIEFASKFSICLLVLIFSIAQLILHSGDCTSEHLYSNFISMILGVFLPSPVIVKKTKNEK